RVMTLAVAGGAFDDWIVIGDARLLRRLRDPVDVGADGDYRFARAPGGHPGGRNRRNASLDRESVLLEDAGEILRGFHLLKTELPEAEHLIDHLLRELAHAVDVSDRVFLQRAQFRVRCDGRAL